MKKSLLFLTAIFFVAQSTFAITHTISASGTSFTPSSIPVVHPGDTIKWVWSSGTHTTTSTTIPGAATSWDQPLNSTSTSAIYVPTVMGTYNYKCTFHLSMGMTGSFVVMPATSIPVVSNQSDFNLFPNPASRSIHLQVSNTDLPVTVSLMNILGKQVMSAVYAGTKDIDVDVQGIPNGTYFMRAAQGAAVFNQQVSVTH